MHQLIVEIHVPLIGTPGPQDGQDPLRWIDDVEDFLRQEQDGPVEVYDVGGQFGDVYVFFLTSADEHELLVVASRAVSLPGIPAGEPIERVRVPSP